MTIDHTLVFQPKQRIITKGDDATQAYVILKGKVHVFLEKGGKTVTLAHLQEGAIFGETALFDRKHYGAHVEAEEETRLGIITPEAFQEKMKSCDPMLRAIILMLIERQRKTNQALLDSETRELIEIALI